MDIMVAALVILALLVGVGMLAARDWRNWRDRKERMEMRWRRKRPNRLSPEK